MAAYKKGDTVVVWEKTDPWAGNDLARIFLVGIAQKDFSDAEWFRFVQDENRAGNATFLIQSLITLGWVQPVRWGEMVIND